MGTEVLEELIDFEIRPIIQALNELPFVQTWACCSGWTGADGVSDGTNRTWTGMPYASVISLDDAEMIRFVNYIAERMIYCSYAGEPENSRDNYAAQLAKGYLAVDLMQVIHFDLEYRREKLLFIVHIFDKDRSPEYVQKIWSLLGSLIAEYKVLVGSGG